MAATEQEQGQQRGQSGGSGGRNAAIAAAATAAASGAAYAVKKIRSRNNDDRSNGSHSKSGSRSVLSSAMSSGWEAAADTLVPIAEDAAGAAGRYVAKRGPDFLKERIVPKFIQAFNDAK